MPNALTALLWIGLFLIVVDVAQLYINRAIHTWVAIFVIIALTLLTAFITIALTLEEHAGILLSYIGV